MKPLTVKEAQEQERKAARFDDLLAALLLIDPTGKFDRWENSQGELIGPQIAAAIKKAKQS